MLLRTLSGVIPVGITLLAIVASPGQPVQEGNYVGANTCRLCHPRQHTSWAATRHERAFELLENSGKTTDEECFPCHTTGHGRPSGFTGVEATPELKGIQCEACHGPGEAHANGAGDKTKITRVPPATVCTRCHMKFSIHELSTD